MTFERHMAKNEYKKINIYNQRRNKNNEEKVKKNNTNKIVEMQMKFRIWNILSAA